jgi:hypothetical protein
VPLSIGPRRQPSNLTVRSCVMKALRSLGKSGNTRRVREVKIHHVLPDREICYAYCDNTAVDLDPLPVSRARLTLVEPALFE